MTKATPGRENSDNAKESLVIPDKEIIWSRILETTSLRIEKTFYSRKTIWKVASIAASIALLVGISGAFILNSWTSGSFDKEWVTKIHCPSGQKTQVFLPDGTSVWLNSNSNLSYSNHFNINERKVELEGEAFFEVTHDSEKKFLVNTSNVSVCVHGTAFNISSYQEDTNIQVSLLNGSVSLLNQHSGEILGKLTPNQMGIISKENFNCQIVPDDASITHLWTMNVLRIYDEDILQVCKKLERWYGVNITLQKPQTKHRYTFVVKTESLRELLQLLNKVTPINYTIEGEEVVIK